ncbi:hypothetical protein JHW43_008000 [Diplocarpon mali]|nr:hypothetical protein JHW43_008000 [Diplocarpon mali]
MDDTSFTAHSPGIVTSDVDVHSMASPSYSCSLAHLLTCSLAHLLVASTRLRSRAVQSHANANANAESPTSDRSSQGSLSPPAPSPSEKRRMKNGRSKKEKDINNINNNNNNKGTRAASLIESLVEKSTPPLSGLGFQSTPLHSAGLRDDAGKTGSRQSGPSHYYDYLCENTNQRHTSRRQATQSQQPLINIKVNSASINLSTTPNQST